MSVYGEYRQEVEGARADVAKALLNSRLHQDGFAREMLEALRNRGEVDWFIGLYIGKWVLSHPEWSVSDAKGRADLLKSVSDLFTAVLDFTSRVYTNAPDARLFLASKRERIWQELPLEVRGELRLPLCGLFGKLSVLANIAYPADPEPEPEPPR